MIKQNNTLKQGKILKVKAGYNPNSSSVGSQIPIFFAFALSSGAMSIIAMNVLAYYDRLLKKKRRKVDNEAPEDH